MRTTYSNISIHKFITEFIESENGQVNDICEEVERKCDKVRENYLESVKADAENETLTTGLEDALKELKDFRYAGFYRVAATKAELRQIEHPLRFLYPKSTNEGCIDKERKKRYVSICIFVCKLQ